MQEVDTQEPKEQKNKDNGVWKELAGWLKCIVIAVVAALLITRFVGERTSVEGSSMETTLSDRDQLIVNKISYRFRDPKRYEIVVFPHYVNGEKKHYIKRVIGLPGETVQVKEGYVYINGELLESEHYGREVMQSAGVADTPIKLGADEYFVLGDNRNNSSDSRDPSVGPQKRADMEGTPWVRIYPFDKMKSF